MTGAPLHDEPFPELLGNPTQVAVSADERWIAVSSVAHLRSRVAVYRAADLSCAHLLTFTMDAAPETVLFTVDAPLGRAVYVADAAGPALLHGETELVRRAFPAGDVLWSRPLHTEVLDLDAHAGVVHALCADDTLVSVDTTDGTVLGRRPLPPYGPLSLHAAPDGTVIVGTSAGQILRY
ncbi:hypothetical protein [Streptomyces sp. NPDC006551]|uniref:hypothetical protein n=1 Tax=Streptomyces sp. NPDC006551 TaxID=3157178 RepID=UPI0033A107BF